jgi:hypothetical protein
MVVLRALELRQPPPAGALSQPLSSAGARGLLGEDTEEDLSMQMHVRGEVSDDLTTAMAAATHQRGLSSAEADHVEQHGTKQQSEVG